MSEFTLDDFRRLLDQAKRLLPLGMSPRMMPGLGIRGEGIGNSEVEKQIRRICGIIDSMTAAERSRPATIDQERLQRITRGSGATLLEVSEPAWLRGLLGDGPTVNLRSTKVTDTALEWLDAFPQLETLYLGDPSMALLRESSDGVVHLESLTVDFVPVTDAGLVRLSRLSQLQVLDLAGTQVTDVGLDYLEKLAQLKNLNLECTSITDVGLEHLSDLTQLQVLDLVGTQVTDNGVA
jgi:hypothetical protein